MIALTIRHANEMSKTANQNFWQDKHDLLISEIWHDILDLEYLYG